MWLSGHPCDDSCGMGASAKLSFAQQQDRHPRIVQVVRQMMRGALFVKQFVLAGLAVLGLGSSAFAAPPAPTMNWTGFYIGGNGGYGWGDRDVDYSPNDPASAIGFSTANFKPPAVSFNSASAIGGIQLGYNWQFNPAWLVGIEADFDWANMKGSASSGGLAGGVSPFAATVDERIKWFGTVRGRLGYLPSPSLLVFMTGGFAYAKVERSGRYVNNDPAIGFGAVLGGFGFTCPTGGATCFTGSSSDVATGWTLGGGVEYAFWQNFTVKAEYLYVDLDSGAVTERAQVLGVAPPGTQLSSINANFSRTIFNVVRLGVNWRF